MYQDPRQGSFNITAMVFNSQEAVRGQTVTRNDVRELFAHQGEESTQEVRCS